MKQIVNRFLLIAWFCVIISFLYAQDLPSATVSQIDSLFKEFNSPNTPGCAIGVVRNDSLIYAKGYGVANLEYDIPITPKTIFYLASVSKQFTGYAILLLAKEGKLNLTDQVRSHLPWIPDFKKIITIRHLLNHTSGIRDDLSMASFGGLGDGIVTQDLAIQYIKNSRALNYDTGEKYLYSNSNYVLLAEIVKERSGKSFKAFVDSALFKPLDMKHSFFLDEPNKLVKNRAASYYKTGNQFNNAPHEVFTLGDGGMFSNIEDLSKWVMNFYNPKVGSAEDISKFGENGILNDGSKIPYALGIVTNQYKGLKQYTHSGSLAGFRTNISVFPELKIAFIVLSNNGTVNATAKSNQLADIFLKNYNPPVSPSSSSETALVRYHPADSQYIKLFNGNYISDDGLRFKFQSNGEVLIWETPSGSKPLVQTGKEMFVDSASQVKFKFSVSANDTTAHQSFTGYNRLLTKYIPDSSFVSNAAASYTGTYFSPELESRLEIIFSDGRLLLKSPKYGEEKLQVLDRYNMLIGTGGIHLKFFMDRKKQATAFEINSARMMHMRFEKVIK